MKKYCICLLFAFTTIFATISLQAQSYQSIFGSTNTIWKIAALNLPGTFTDSLYSTTDTVINTKIYKTIRSSYIQNIVGFLREDSLNSVGYFYSTFDTLEREIYDFNLMVGDSFYFNGAWPIIPGYHIVDSVYTLSGKKHLRFDSSTFWNEKFEFIESVGVNINLDYQSNSLRQNSFLLCNYQDNFINYLNSNSNFNGCDLITGINEIAQTEITLYPNPTFDVFQINLLKEFEIELFNEIGCRIFFQSNCIQNKIISMSDIARNAYGVYFVRIKSNNAYSFFKLIYINH
jgi:hypothetical protein